MLKCNVKFLQQSLECNKCDKKFESHMELKEHIKYIHETKKCVVHVVINLISHIN